MARWIDSCGFFLEGLPQFLRNCSSLVSSDALTVCQWWQHETAQISLLGQISPCR